MCMSCSRKRGFKDWVGCALSSVVEEDVSRIRTRDDKVRMKGGEFCG